MKETDAAGSAKNGSSDIEGAPAGFGAGSVPQAWDQRCHVLEVALEVWPDGGVGRAQAEGSGALEDENRKLKKLLAESMLDAATLKEMLGKTSNVQSAENGRDLGDPEQGLLRLEADQPARTPLRKTHYVGPAGRCT